MSLPVVTILVQIFNAVRWLLAQFHSSFCSNILYILLADLLWKWRLHYYLLTSLLWLFIDKSKNKLRCFVFKSLYVPDCTPHWTFALPSMLPSARIYFLYHQHPLNHIHLEGLSPTLFSEKPALSLLPGGDLSPFLPNFSTPPTFQSVRLVFIHCFMIMLCRLSSFIFHV